MILPKGVFCKRVKGLKWRLFDGHKIWRDEDGNAKDQGGFWTQKEMMETLGLTRWDMRPPRGSDRVKRPDRVRRKRLLRKLRLLHRSRQRAKGSRPSSSPTSGDTAR